MKRQGLSGKSSTVIAKMFHSNKHVCLQCHSYLEVSSKDYLVTIAMDAFVCSVKSYLEVVSRDYLVTSDKHVRL